MNWTFSYNASQQLLRITARGNFSPSECMEIKREFLAADYWTPGIKLLYDYRETNFDSVTLEQLRTICDYHVVYSTEIGPGKLAFLMSSPRDFGYARQYEMITDGKTLSQIRVFQDEEKALEWLLSDSI